MIRWRVSADKERIKRVYAMKFYGKEGIYSGEDETRPQIQIWDDPLLDSVLSFARDTRELITIEIHVTYRGGCIMTRGCVSQKKEKEKGTRERAGHTEKKETDKFWASLDKSRLSATVDRSLKQRGIQLVHLLKNGAFQ